MVTQVIGDVRDRPCFIIDDMITTGGTIAQAVEALLTAGAQRDIVVAATHGLFVGEAPARLGHPAIQRIFATDSVAADRPLPRLRVVSIAPLFAEAIRRIHSGESLGDLFHDAPTS